MAHIAAVHDLSGIGRCSLVAAISVLSTMGHQPAPLPTALLSKQTGFPGYSYLDFTPHIPEYLQGWEGIQFQPDLIYTGFLGSSVQAGLLQEYIGKHPSATAVVDPVMGDGGVLYPCYDQAFADSMVQLAASAHILTPNFTEFFLLAGEDPRLVRACPDDRTLLQMARHFASERLRLVVITGVHNGPDSCNILLDMAAGTVTRLPVRHTGISYSGTGDLFASIFCGCTAFGMPPELAVQTGAAFLEEVAAAAGSGDPRYGLPYEPYLYRLSPHYLKGEVTQ